MADKFIPDRDIDFANMARIFARSIERHETHFNLSEHDLQIIDRAVTEFREKLGAATRPGTRTQYTIMEKDESRAKAEQVIRKYGRVIRADESISRSDKIALRMKERPAKLGSRTCPQTRPLLTFRGSCNEGGLTGRKHILRFGERLGNGTRAKPPGAARLELFMELVAEGEPIPKHPGELCGGRAWYLRSFTRSPMEVEFPMPATPMFVVYWARWADATGNVGPFSQTCVATVEGWSGRGAMLPDLTQARRRQQKIVITSARMELPDYERGIEEVSAGVGRLLPAAQVVNR
jgi:hypothetical protein